MSKGIKFTGFMVGILALRLVSMIFVPLAETTESRYAEIARLMATRNDWITPWFETGVPFWGKPPLAFWAQAISFNLFGISELAARLPFWLAGLATLWILWRFVSSISTHRIAQNTLIIYSTTALAYVATGAIMTDPFLVLGTTWSMAAYFLAPAQPVWIWRYGFFLGMAIGLLAKGPLAGVITFGPIVMWTILVPSARAHIKALPWLRGSLLTMLITLPWYIAAELKTPGFLNYFIIGEHFMRFIDPGWGGDLYGSAHRHARGAIWLQWLMASFPWGLVALAMLLWSAATRKASGLINQNNGTAPAYLFIALGTVYPPVLYARG